MLCAGNPPGRLPVPFSPMTSRRQGKGCVTVAPLPPALSCITERCPAVREEDHCGGTPGRSPLASATSWRTLSASWTQVSLRRGINLLFLAETALTLLPRIHKPPSSESDRRRPRPCFQAAALGGPFARLPSFIQRHLPTRWSSKCSDLWGLYLKLYLENWIVG